jgi:hypothetical protein
MLEQLPTNPENTVPAHKLTITQLAMALRVLEGVLPEQLDVISESAKKLEQLQNLSTLLGLVAPGGSAPRTALEQLWKQSSDNAEETPVLKEFRSMLSGHHGEWTPALREAEGLPPRKEA